jgi:glycosyltransferase involved in cell wall biosynthesis
LKVALVHDWLTGMRGGEKCLEAACELYPDADVFTLLHRSGSVSPTIERHRVVTSFLQRLPNVHRYYRYLLPFYPTAVERFDLSGYDLVLSMSHAVAKGAIPAPHAEHACYCFSPMRYVWDLYDDYFGRTPKPLELVISICASYLRTWDVGATARVDRIAAISRHVERRVARYYRREATVIYPPVEDVYFETPLARGKGEYFLMVTSLVPYKRIDVAIAAFAKTVEPLWIVGSGPEARRLKSLAPPNVRFLGWQPAERMPDLYRGARALVFPGIEDFGIAPVECQAVGRPVVGLRAGGLCETVRPIGNGGAPTGVLYGEPTVEGLLAGLEVLRQHESAFDPGALRRHAEGFRRERFLAELASFAGGRPSPIAPFDRDPRPTGAPERSGQRGRGGRRPC